MKAKHTAKKTTAKRTRVELPPIEARPWYTLEEAAALLGFKRNSAQQLIHREVFPVPYVKFGQRVAVIKDVLDAYFEQQREAGLAALAKKKPAA